MKFQFKEWLNEVAEPARPPGRVRKANRVKNAGTNTAGKSVQFNWTTQLGNKVSLHFDHNGDDVYEVMFYVNGVLHDDAAKTEGGRDPEILSGVFYLLKKKAEELGAKELQFRAHVSEGDTRVVRGLDPEKYKPQLLKAIDDLDQVILSYKPQMIPPSQTKLDLWQKLNRGIPEPEADFRPEVWHNWLNKLRKAIQDNQIVDGFVDTIKTVIGTNKFKPLGIDLTSFVTALEDYSNAVLSNTERGWIRRRNRRASIYDTLLKRYFTDSWIIERDGNFFRLFRK